MSYPRVTWGCVKLTSTPVNAVLLISTSQACVWREAAFPSCTHHNPILRSQRDVDYCSTLTVGASDGSFYTMYLFIKKSPSIQNTKRNEVTFRFTVEASRIFNEMKTRSYIYEVTRLKVRG